MMLKALVLLVLFATLIQKAMEFPWAWAAICIRAPRVPDLRQTNQRPAGALE